MDDQYIRMLQYATGVQSPLRFEVFRTNGEPEQVELNKPFVVIGRHPTCDIVVNDPVASGRHLYLQAIGPRLAAFDLFSSAGTYWGQSDFDGWLNHTNDIQIPGAQLKLTDSFWVRTPQLTHPLDFRTRHEQREEYGPLPTVDLELLNGKTGGERWPINRVVTLIGRDERCRITIVDSRILRAHCALLLLPSGLWVIDLTGSKAFTVNGEQHACCLLTEGAELKVGPYLMAARYPDLDHYETAIGAQPKQSPLYEGESDFLTKQNRIFKTEIFGETLVISPLGDSQSFFYQDIHNEASRVMDVIRKRQFRNIVIDFSQTEAMGHMVVDALSSFCRAAPGKAALCACNVENYDLLQRTKLSTNWPHYQSRLDAMQAVWYQT